MIQHIKSLYVQAHIDGKPIDHVLVVDNSLDINIIPLSMVKRQLKLVEDLIHTEVSISSFAREIIRLFELLPINVKLTMGT